MNASPWILIAAAAVFAACSGNEPATEVYLVSAVVLAPRAEPPEPEVTPAPAILHVDTNPFAATVWLGTRRLGPTGRDLEVEAGTFEVTIRSDGPQALFREQTLRVAVAPGERASARVPLSVLPSQLQFPTAWDPACRVIHDGEAVGTLAELPRRRLVVPRPDLATVIEIACPDGGPGRVVEYASGAILPPAVSFPPPT